MKKKEIEKYLDLALRSVKKCDKITLGYYKKKLKHKMKKNLTPVTVADFKAEDFLIEKIKKNYPSHSIFSEERGFDDNGSDFRWIIDPIDGTKNFMRKYPFWGTLLALEWEGEVIAGVISMPALKTTIFASKGSGCFVNGKKARVSKVKQLKLSYILHGGIEYISGQAYLNNFLSLVSSCSYNRGFGDCHGHSLVITGKAEAMVDPFVAPYDIAAVKICIEEAGGILTDVNGNKTIYGGSAVVSNGFIHDEVLKILNYGIESREKLMTGV
ncbi:MAG: histidinol phosphate phosphatase [Ignavibacteria bacterium]|nr:histidinol phosphate phosphatase [Ignavibacteria bacterium]